MGREVHGVEIRALTRNQVKELKDKGFGLTYYTAEAETPELLNEGFEKAIDWGVVDKEAFEKLGDEEHPKTTAVFFGICKETYGASGEEKNLPESGNGTQIDPD